jgi:hypothetical protein
MSTHLASTCSNGQMRDEIEAACAQLAELMRERELLLRRHVELRNRLNAQSTEMTELRARHALGQRNVDRLEGLSLTRVFLALRGARGDELARERAEADAARHRVAEAEARLAAVRAELTTVDARLARLTGVPERHQAALDDKERYLREAGGPEAAPLIALAEERGRLEAELRELAEATTAADSARKAVAELARHVDSAVNWSAFDSLVGGGPFAGSLRYERLDEAALAAAHADRCLALLHTELAGVGLRLDVGDAGFDTFFVDLLFRQHIKSAQQTVVAAIRTVGEMLRDLARLTSATQERLAAIARERLDLLAR